MNYSIHRRSLYTDLGIIGDKLSPEFAAYYFSRFILSTHIFQKEGEWYRTYIDGRWPVIVKSQSEVRTHRGKSSRHRVFVRCNCNREIPAGRFQQHRKACSK